CGIAGLLGNLLHPEPVKFVLLDGALAARRDVHGHRELLPFDELDEHLALVFGFDDAWRHSSLPKKADYRLGLGCSFRRRFARHMRAVALVAAAGHHAALAPSE